MSVSTILMLLTIALYVEAGRARYDVILLATRLDPDLKADDPLAISHDLPRLERVSRSLARLTFILFWPFVALCGLFMRRPK